MSRSLACLLLLLSACAEEPMGDGSLLPVEQAAPPLVNPTTFEIHASDVVRGYDLEVTVEGHPPGAPVFLIASINPGPGGTPACPPPLAGGCLDIAAPFRVLGSVQASPAGLARFTIPIPSTLAAPALAFQAVSKNATDMWITPAVTLPVRDPISPSLTVPEARAAAITEIVETSGTVVGVSGIGFMLQDDAAENAGIWVYTGFGVWLPEVGDEVIVGAVRSEFGSANAVPPLETLAQLSFSGAPAAYWVRQGGAGTLPAAVPVTIADLSDPNLAEPLEGMRVQLTGPGRLTVASDPASTFGDFLVSGGPTTEQVFVDQAFFDLPAAITGFGVGDSFAGIAGVLNFSFGEYRVAPVRQADAVDYVPAP
jgi:hypothetical protein